MSDLRYLIAEAVALGGENPCATGHQWETDGCRGCPTGNPECGQSVYRCSRCGEWDYGTDPDSPGLVDCRAACGDSLHGWRPPDWLDDEEEPR